MSFVKVIKKFSDESDVGG